MFFIDFILIFNVFIHLLLNYQSFSLIFHIILGVKVHLYPTTSQYVVSIPFKTAPNEQTGNSDVSGFATHCPSRFVVPEHPDSEYVDYIPGSGCAQGCRYVCLSVYNVYLLLKCLFYLLLKISFKKTFF